MPPAGVGSEPASELLTTRSTAASAGAAANSVMHANTARLKMRPLRLRSDAGCVRSDSIRYPLKVGNNPPSRAASAGTRMDWSFQGEKPAPLHSQAPTAERHPDVGGDYEQIGGNPKTP